MGSHASKMNAEVQNPPATPNEIRIRDGTRLLEMVWYSIAEDVVARAIQLYDLSPDQAAALRRAFLRPNDYYVLLV
jgi:hypothetical protein